MPYRNLLIKCSKRHCKRSRGISMYQNKIRSFLLKNRLHISQNIRRNGCQRLRWFHDVKIVIYLDLKNVDDLHQHLFMLARKADHAFNFRMFLQSFDQRTHLDGLRSGSEHTHYLHAFFSFNSSVICLIRSSHVFCKRNSLCCCLVYFGGNPVSSRFLISSTYSPLS